MPAPPFTLHGLGAGARRVAPLLPGIVLYGLAFGILAGAQGLSTLEAGLFSGWVNAGAAQLATLEAWGDPIPLFAVCLTTLAMNARYVLLGAAIRPWFAGLPAWQSYPSLMVMGDGNWTLALREFRAGRMDAAFLIGSGLMMWLVWISTSMIGQAFGAALGEPQRFGVDLMLPAFFAAMVPAFAERLGSLLPLVTGALAAILVERLVEGPWYILAGALAGSLVGALAHVARA